MKNRYSVNITIHVNYETDEMTIRELKNLVKSSWTEGDVFGYIYDKEERKVSQFTMDGEKLTLTHQ